MNFDAVVNAGTFGGFVVLFGLAVAWYTKIVRPEQREAEARGVAEREKLTEDITSLEARIDKLENRLQTAEEGRLRYRLLLIEHGIPIPD